MSTSAPEQPTPGQDPQTPAAPSGAPWSAALNQAFPDPAQAAAVDQFLRGQVQPRVTQLEQQVAQSRDGQRLLSDFQSDPLGTYMAISTELLGDEHAEQIRNMISQQQNPMPPEPTPPAMPGSDPRLDELYNWKEERVAQERAAQEAQEVQARYDSETARVVQQYPDVDTNTRLFHMSVSAANGDFDLAAQMYREEKGAAPPPEAPPAMGSDTAAGGGDTPVEYQAASVSEAIDNWWRQTHATSDAPPVA